MIKVASSLALALVASLAVALFLGPYIGSMGVFVASFAIGFLARRVVGYILGGNDETKA